MLPTPALDVIALGPVSCGAMVWRSAGVLRVTVVVKAKLSLVPDQDASVTAPSGVARDDRHVDGDPARSLQRASDLMPYLPNAGVVLMGRAHAPSGRPATSVSARLAVFAAQALFDKTIHVFGDVAPGGSMPAPFQTMPLVYERAYGGASVPSNPVGTGLPGTRRPNLVHPTNAHRPAGFGSIAPHWPSRRRFWGGAEPALGPDGILDVPAGADFRAFNPAPTDQQIPYLSGDEWIVMDNLSPERPRVQTRLPALRAEARCYENGVASVIALVADTLAIDADRQTASLIWRGNLVIDRLERLAGLRLYAGLHQPGATIPWPEARVAEAGIADPLTTTGITPTSPVLPFEEKEHEGAGDPNAQTGRIVASMLRQPVLPFQNRNEAPPAREETVVVSTASLFQGVNAPFAITAAGGPTARDAEIPGAPWSAAPAPPPPAAPEEQTLIHALPRRDPAPVPVPEPPIVVHHVPEPPRPAPNPAPPEPPAESPPASVLVPPPAPSAPSASSAPASPDRRRVEAKLAEGGTFDDDDLSGVDLSGLDFSGRSLRRCTLRGAKLRCANLGGAVLVAARMEDADLSGALLEGADLDRANLSRALLTDARLDRAKLSEAVLEKADLDRASLAGANLEGARLARAHGEGAILDRSILKGADLRSARFPGASFTEADLREAQGDQGDFTGARFVRADLGAASLRKAVLTGAVLAHAQLEGTDLRSADLERANVHGASRKTAKMSGANVKDLDESA